MIGVEEEKKKQGRTHQIRLPQTLAHAEELLGGGAADDEVLGEVDAADGVEAADEGAPRLGLEPGDDGADEPGAEAALVQGRGHEVREGGRRDPPLLPQPVHVHLVPEHVRHGRHVRRQARQAQEHVLPVLEDLREVVRHRERLHAQPQVARDRHAVLAYHRYAGAAVCCVSKGLVRMNGSGSLSCHVMSCLHVLSCHDMTGQVGRNGEEGGKGLCRSRRNTGRGDDVY